LKFCMEVEARLKVSTYFEYATEDGLGKSRQSRIAEIRSLFGFRMSLALLPTADEGTECLREKVLILT